MYLSSFYVVCVIATCLFWWFSSKYYLLYFEHGTVFARFYTRDLSSYMSNLFIIFLSICAKYRFAKNLEPILSNIASLASIFHLPVCSLSWQSGSNRGSKRICHENTGWERDRSCQPRLVVPTIQFTELTELCLMLI